MVNKHQVRVQEFAMHREWAEKQSSDKLHELLNAKKVRSGKATAAREVLRARGD